MPRAGGQLRGEPAAQPAARLLDPFDGAHIRLLVGHPHSPPRSIRKTKKTQKTTGPLPIGKRAHIALHVVSELSSRSSGTGPPRIAAASASPRERTPPATTRWTASGDTAASQTAAGGTRQCGGLSTAHRE